MVHSAVHSARFATFGMASLARRLDVGIVGLGTAGAAAAIFLARQGHRVKLFEKTPAAQLHGAGAGIGVQPIGLTVLKHLGILEPILAHGRRIDRLHAMTETGRTVLDLRYADYRPELYGVGLHRDVLFRELHEAAQAEPNIEIEYGFDAAGLDVAGAGAAQNAIRGADGDAAGPFDLLVVADGRSSIRSTTSARAYERWYPYGCLWAILPDADGAFTSEGLLQQKLSAGSAREMLGFLPCGRTHGSHEQLVSLFWSLDMATLDAVREAGFEAWGARVVELEPKAAGLVDELRRRGGLDALIPAAYSDTFMPQYFHGSACVFLGDAAHACSPQLGQGANLALVDAWTLAESVAACGADAPAAVRKYDAARRWRLRFYQLNSRMLTPVFQSDSAVVGTMRDALLGPLCYFPLSRLQMLTTLVGAQNNGIPWTTIPEEEFMGFTR